MELPVFPTRPGGTGNYGVGKIVVVYLTVNQGARVRFPPSPQIFCSVSSAVERYLDTVEVTGSTPVLNTI